MKHFFIVLQRQLHQAAQRYVHLTWNLDVAIETGLTGANILPSLLPDKAA